MSAVTAVPENGQMAVMVVRYLWVVQMLAVILLSLCKSP